MSFGKMYSLNKSEHKLLWDSVEERRAAGLSGSTQVPGHSVSERGGQGSSWTRRGGVEPSRAKQA